MTHAPPPIGSWLRDTPLLILGILAVFALLTGCAAKLPLPKRPSVSTQFIAQDVAAASGRVTVAKTHTQSALTDLQRADAKEVVIAEWERQHPRK